jgi:hypothetical protein
VNVESLIGRRVQQPLRFAATVGGISPTALGQNVSDGTAPTGAGLLQIY